MLRMEAQEFPSEHSAEVKERRSRLNELSERQKQLEESLEKLVIIREKLRQRDWETSTNLKAKMVFLKREGG